MGLPKVYKSGLIRFFRDTRVISSVGRASALQAECRRFDSVITHQKVSEMRGGSSVG